MEKIYHKHFTIGNQLTETLNLLNTLNLQYRVNSDNKIEILCDLTLKGLNNLDLSLIESIAGDLNITWEEDVKSIKFKDCKKINLSGLKFVKGDINIDFSKQINLKSLVCANWICLTNCNNVNIRNIQNVSMLQIVESEKINLKNLQCCGSLRLKDSKTINLSNLIHVSNFTNIIDSDTKLIPFVNVQREIKNFNKSTYYVNNTSMVDGFNIYEIEHLGGSYFDEISLYAAEKNKYTGVGVTIDDAIFACISSENNSPENQLKRLYNAKNT